MSSPALASAWNPEAGHGEIISAGIQVSADRGIDGFGETVEIERYIKRSTHNYGLVGITDRVALIGALDWQFADLSAGELDVKFSGASRIEGGLQYQLHRSDTRAVALSASVLAGVSPPVALQTLEGRDTRVELRALWGEGVSLMGRKGFVEAQAAGRMTVGGRYSGTRLQLSAGIRPTERLELIVKGRYVRQEPGDIDGFLVGSQTRWETESVAALRVFGQNFLEVGYVETVHAHNAVMERGFKIGSWLKF